MYIDYTRSIVTLPATLLRHHGLPSPHPAHPLFARLLAHDYDHVVFVVLDGLGMNLVEAMDDKAWLKRHTVESLQSTFPSTTVAATTSLLTGLTPYESGHIGWFQYVQPEATHYTVFTKHDYYDPTKHIAPSVHAKFAHERVLDRIDEAHSHVAAAHVFPTPIDADGHTTLAEGFERVKRFQAEHPRTVVYLYSTEPDLTQHVHGVHSKATQAVLRSLDEAIASYASTLGRNCLMVATADHGLTDVTPLPIMENLALTKTFLRNPAVEPRATAFFIKPGLHNAFVKLFNATYGEDFTLYTAEYVLESGMLGRGKKHPLVDDTIGDFLAVAKTNKYFELVPGTSFKAHHAATTPDEMRVPFVVYAPKGLI